MRCYYYYVKAYIAKWRNIIGENLPPGKSSNNLRCRFIDWSSHKEKFTVAWRQMAP